MAAELKWYAVYTKPRWEKKVARLLTEKRILNYCPLNRVMRLWSDRKKIVFEPLFKSYVFVQIEEAEKQAVRQTDGILNFVNWLGRPAVIKDEEIELIRKFLDDHQNVKAESSLLKLNDKVRINSGPLMYEEGDIIEIKSTTVKVFLPSLRIALFAEVDKANVSRLS